MVKPDAKLMAEAQVIFRQAAALRDRGLGEEADAVQAKATKVWRRALGYVDQESTP